MRNNKTDQFIRKIGVTDVYADSDYLTDISYRNRV